MIRKAETILETLDPEVISRLATRRGALQSLGKLGYGLAAASVPVALGTMAKAAFGQALPAGIVAVLNFALTLEYLEAEFYQTGIDTAGLIPAEDRNIFDQIRIHENAHVALLLSVLGSSAVAKPTFDFTGGDGSNNGPFRPFQVYATFQALAQGFEDTGVRAYKGQATALKSNDTILETALRIHSVEARHASEVRRLRGQKGWITDDDTDVAALAAIYAGEGNTVHAGIDAAALSPTVSRNAVTEAFDEPLTMAQVLAIVDPFILGDQTP